MILDIIKIGGQILDKIIPDPEARAKAKLSLVELQQKGELAVIQEQSSIIQAEAKGESALQRNWRPAIMLTFGALIVAKWLGFTAPGISEAVELEILNIIKVGLGGYVVGRSAEKAIKEWKK